MIGRTQPSEHSISALAPTPSEGPLSLHLRQATRELHRQAERTGLMAELLRGDIGRLRYGALLSNLHALYAALEAALDRHAAYPGFATFNFPVLRRAGSIAADLQRLRLAQPPLSEAMLNFVARIRKLADGEPLLLIAHAYVRYLGDLNGGQTLSTIVARTLNIESGALHFFDFGPPDAVAHAIARFRAALDALPIAGAEDAQALVDEARWSFAQHVLLFDELALAAGSSPR